MSRTEKHVHDEATAERGKLFCVALLGEREGVRCREQPFDVAAVEVADREQVTAIGAGRRPKLAGDKLSERSLILFPPRVGDEDDAIDLVDLQELDLDTLVAGRRQVLAYVVGPDRKLRCPRSASTASWTRAGRPYSSRASIADRIVRPV